MIHPETQKVLDYPDSIGRRIALEYYDWVNLTQYEEIHLSRHIIRLAEMIDNEVKKNV